MLDLESNDDTWIPTVCQQKSYWDEMIKWIQGDNIPIFTSWQTSAYSMPLAQAPITEQSYESSAV